MRAPLRRRRGGSAWIVVIDIVRDAGWTRNWLILLILALSAAAAALAMASQVAIPWAIYPAL